MSEDITYGTPLGSGRAGTPLAWLALTCIATVVSTLQKLPCLRGRADTDVLATAQCYSDIPLFYVGRGLAADFGWLGHLPPGYRNLEYPPLINLVIEACGKLTHLATGLDESELEARAQLSAAELYDLPGMADEERAFFFVNCAGILLCAVLIVWVVWRAGVRVGTPWGWIVSTPIVVLTLTLNWDAVALLFTVLAIVAWRAGQWTRFGLWVALGTAAKLFPLVLLAAGLILLIRLRQVRAAAGMLGGFAVVTLATNLPLWLSNNDAWAEFWNTNTERPASFGSLWIAMRMIGFPVDADALSLILGLGMVATWLGLAALTWTGWIEPTLAELSLVFLIFFFALGKVYSPQYSLWVVLGLLLVTRNMWLITSVALAETAHYVATWLYIRGFTTPEAGVDKTYWASIVVRLVMEGVAVLAVLHAARKRAVGDIVPDRLSAAVR